jgi:N4-gp56 family major capsid protein
VTAPSNTTGTMADVVRAAYNQSALYAFRASSVHRATADIKWAPGQGPQRSNVVTFTKINAMAVATAALAEATEPAPVALGDTQVSITLVEQGNVTKTTRKLRLTSLIDFDAAAAREVSANMEESLDVVARDILVAGSNVIWSGAATSRVTVAAGHTLAGNDVRKAVQKLKKLNSPHPMGMGNYYWSVIHPDVAYDLMVESGSTAGWLQPHAYSAPENIWAGEIGAFGGARFVENANAKMVADAGVGGTVDVYITLFMGQQALGEGVADPQHIVVTSGLDDLQRFTSIGWYYLGGFGIIRNESLVRVESASSLGTNV